MTTTPRVGATLLEDTDTLTGLTNSFKTKVNDALARFDAGVGRTVCTSTTRPSTQLFIGREIWESDTGRSYVNMSGTVGDWRLIAENVINNIGSGRVRVTRPIRPYGGDTAHSAFPDVVQLLNGTCVMVYRQGTDHVTSRDGIVRKATSTDQGRSWTAPTTIVSGGGGVDLRDPCISLRRDGTTLMLTYFKGTSVLAAAGVFFRTSTDGGTTWSAETRVDGGSPYAASSAKCIELDNGTLCIPYYGRAGVETIDSVWIAKSTNGGTSWTQTRLVNGPTAGLDMQEPWMVLKGQQAIIAYRHGTADNIGTTTSNDNTANWSAGTIRFAGTGRPMIFWASNDTLACIFRQNSSSPGVYNAMIRTSRDAGVNWYPARIVEKVWNAGSWMTYAGCDKLTSGSTLVVMGNESATNQSRIFIMYAGESGCSTPLGMIEQENTATITNSDNVLFSTNFEQLDGSLGYPWFVVAGAATVTNGELASTSADNVVDLCVVHANVNDMEVEAEINCGGTGTIQTGAAVIFRMISATTYLMFTVETSGVNFRLYKVVSSTATQLMQWNDGSTQRLPTNQYIKYKVIARGGSIWVFINDQFLNGNSAAWIPSSSYDMSGGDYTTFQPGRFAGVKLNSQGTSIHKCRRFVVKG